ncbi:phosphate/phosphite/phosphonate ABC transporter substrate-binding protein [Flavobacteriaceae bacterium MHTCC 0001]
MKKGILLICLLTIVISCGKKKDSFSNPKELILCLSITEDYDKTVGKKEALEQHLSSSLHMPVKIHQVTNGSAAIEAVKAEKAHISSVGAFSYIVAKTKADISPLATTAAVSDTVVHNYSSCLIVSKNSPLNTIEDLKNKKSNLSLAWSYPTSTSGHLVPRAYLKSIGILPDDFKEVLTAENHVAAIYSCITEKIDIAAVGDITLKEYSRRGKISSNDYKIMWKSKPIQRGVFFISNKVNKDLKNKIEKALTELHVISKEKARAVHYQYDYDVKYVPVSDSDYDGLRGLAKNIGLIE